MSYRLLRNNKESGPFSFDELVQMGLKPYDLIWVDGKSAGWRYPSEINELKPFAPVIEEQPFDRFYKKPADQPKKNPIISTPLNKEESKAKPRIKITAVSNKIEPIHSNEKKLVEEPVHDSPHWKEMYAHWENKKLQEETGPKPQQPNQPSVPLEEQVLQDVPDSMEPDPENILLANGPQDSKSKNNNALIFLLGLLIISLGTWVAYSWSKTASHNPEELKIETVENNSTPPLKPEVEPIAAKANESKNLIEPEGLNKADEVVINTNNKLPENNTVIPSENTAVAKPTKTKEAVKDAPEIKQPVATTTDKPVIKQEPAKTGKEVTKQLTEKPDNSTILKEKKTSPKIVDYIKVSSTQPNEGSVAGIKYKIKNVSETPVDLIMLDLMYYDANGKFKKGETVYVRNVAPGQTVNLPAPENAEAAKIKYKISMISAESQGLYLIAD